MSSVPREEFLPPDLGEDAAQRSLLEGRDQMIDETVSRALGILKDNEFIMVGGIKGVARRIVARLDESVGERAFELTGLRFRPATLENWGAI